MAQLYEYYNTGDDDHADPNGSYWVAQTFTIGASAHTISSVKLKLYRVGSPGTVTVSIRATDAGGKPTGNDLTSGTTDGNTLPTGSPYEWREITLTEYTLSANTKYAIVVRATGGNSSNKVCWRGDTSSPTYTGGNALDSSDSGNTWTSYSNVDNMFEVWGNPLVTLKTVTDSLSFSDAILRNKTLLPIADAVALADALLRNKTLTIADSVGAADSVLGNKNPLIVSDAVSLADLVNVIIGAILKTVTDAIGISDTALINKTAIIADAVDLVDEVFRHKPSITILDAVGVVETVLVAKLCTIADYVSLADVAAVLKTLNVSDTLALIDAVSTPSRVLQALDATGLADNALVNKTLQITENISLVEVVEVGTGGVKKTKLFLILGDLAVQLTGE